MTLTKLPIRSTHGYELTPRASDINTIIDAVNAGGSGALDISLMTRVRTVGPTGCQFTTISAAIADYVTAVGAGLTSSANQPLVILVYPGYYDIANASKSYGIALNGLTTTDGADADVLTHVHLIGLDRDSCVLDFTDIGTASTSPRAFECGSKSKVANFTIINDTATRTFHWDTAVASAYMWIENIRHITTGTTTDGKSVVSTGIRGGQKLVVRNVHSEGAADFAVHGSASGSGIAYVQFSNLSSDGTITDISGTKRQSGINIDGQVSAPAHSLVASITNISFPEALEIAGGNIGLVIKHPTNSASWVYKVDGSLRISFSGTADTSSWNSFHFPQPVRYFGASGVALQEGDVAVLDVANQKLTTTTTKGDLWPVIIARPVGTDNVQPRYPVICTGPYAYVPIVTADAVAIGDTIVTSTTARSATVDNTVILTNKIIGWSEEAKTGGVAGRVKVRLNKAWIG